MKKIIATLILTTLSTIFILAQTSNTTSVQEQDCYNFLDKCVKECNGGLVSTSNFHQLYASFNYDGYTALTDEKMHDERDVQIFKTTDIQWQHLINVNINELTFQYSCICIDFANGFPPNSFWKRSTHFNKDNFDTSDIKLNKFPYDNLYQNHKQGRFSIVVKKEQAKKCVDMINRLHTLAQSKSSTASSQQLKKQEKFNGEYLHTWYTDSNGIIQGRYEIKDRNGNLISYGDYKDNVKIGKWVEDGKIKMYEEVSNDCWCRGYH